MTEAVAFSLWLFMAGGTVGYMVGYRRAQRHDAHAVAVAEWLASAVVSVRNAHRFAGDLEISNTGQLKVGSEIYSVTVERADERLAA